MTYLGWMKAIFGALVRTQSVVRGIFTYAWSLKDHHISIDEVEDDVRLRQLMLELRY